VRVLTYIKRLDDCFGDFLVWVVCDCGACREIQPQALARLFGWKMTSGTSRHGALLRMREKSCRGCSGCYAEEAHSVGVLGHSARLGETHSIRRGTKMKRLIVLILLAPVVASAQLCGPVSYLCQYAPMFTSGTVTFTSEAVWNLSTPSFYQNYVHDYGILGGRVRSYWFRDWSRNRPPHSLRRGGG